MKDPIQRLPAVAALALGCLALPLPAPAALVYENYTFTTLAGPPEAGLGWHDGNSQAARFNYPAQVAFDQAGNVYVADTFNHTIRKVTPDGFVATLAGLAGATGTNDGIGVTARFNSPQGVAVASDGTVYVADTSNHAIRRITPSGQVSVLAGAPGKAGSSDGTGGAARFKSPAGIAIDSAGNLYIADTRNHTIRKIDPDGVVTTLAGKPGASGTANGAKSAARFNNPVGIAVDAQGNVFIGDSFNDCVRQITPAGVVSTLAGKPGTPGSQNGTGNAASFSNPCGVGVDTNGNVYVADASNSLLRKIAPGGVVTTYAGLVGFPGTADGTNSNARFDTPVGIVSDAAGNLIIADTFNHTLRRLPVNGGVTTFAGVASAAGTNDATGSAAGFSFPFGIGLDAVGNAYVADSYNHTIRKVTPGGAVTTLAGTTGASGTNDGTGVAAKFNYPFDLAVDAGGNVYVTDTYNYTIRKITPGGVVSTVAGNPGVTGASDGLGAAAKFKFPIGIAVDPATNIYVADANNNTIRKITPDGNVSTFAGRPGASGSSDGTGGSATFNNPFGVATDAAGNVFVADTSNQTIRKITPAGVVTTIAGKVGTAGHVDGASNAARFSNPRRLTTDGANIYVAEGDNALIRKISAAGVVTTLAGAITNTGSADGAGVDARFDNPEGIAVDANGNLYLADAGNHVLRKGNPVLPDAPTVDVAQGAVGEARHLSIANQTTTNWSWTFLRYPANSSAQFSSASAPNPSLTPDVPDQYNVRFEGWDANGHVALGTVSVGVDTVSPTLAITSPTAGQRWSNAVFTATGTAGDAGSIAGVWCQVNSGAWQLALGTTNWSVALNLTPGTNLVAAYASDAAGNNSRTSTVALVYVQSAILVVQVNGSGAITPNLDGQLLEIGKTYSMTAKPAKNFRFVDWTGSITTNTATLSFTMASNLNFVANFLDGLKPSLKITSPTMNQKWSNAVFTVRGTAGDNQQIDSVWCQVNTNDAWLKANGTTNWFLDVALNPGNNLVRAYALDVAGNASTTNSAGVLYVVSDRLTLVLNGKGTLTPNYSNTLLQIGGKFSVTAKPAAGYWFSNWTDGADVLLTNSPTLSFFMQSNLVLQANFARNPFAPLKGNYVGLFYDPNQVSTTNAGLITASLTDNGSFTAKLLMPGGSNSLSGQFSITGAYSNSIARPGNSPLSVQLQLDLVAGASLRGSISDGNWLAPLVANRAVYSKTNPIPSGKGAYTLVIDGGQDPATQPAGFSVGAFTIDSTGALALSGTLADGTKLAEKTFVSEDGQWPLYASLYSGKGLLLGWLTLTNEPDNDLAGQITWINLGSPAAKLYPQGFELSNLAAVGSVYSFTNGTRVVPSLTNGVVILDGGNLSEPITNGITLGANNVVTSTNRTNLKITTKTGLFQGSVIRPDGKSNTVSGALLQKRQAGYGYFAGTNQVGSVILLPVP